MDTLEQAIAWGMEQGYCDDAFAAEYRAKADDPSAVRQFIMVMALYAKTRYEPTVSGRQEGRLMRADIRSGVLPAFFEGYV
jgi:hypothetical protein